MEPNDKLWQAKLAAWIHDPAEKALVLLRDPAGHEGGTVRELRERLFPGGKIDSDIKSAVKRADHWASAADRPQFPRSEKDGRYAGWAQVDFSRRPVLIHPLSGTEYDLKSLDIDVGDAKEISQRHFMPLIQERDGKIDSHLTALSFWRFGPDRPKDDSGFGALWEQLPADTRVPQHSIWEHLDLCSAFATAMCADAEANPALLAVSFGPVQGFIAQARTTSDLWAGSHLLSRIAWEGMKVVCEQLGPDAVIFPRLRGVPQVDLWLREQGVKGDWQSCEWCRSRTDSNPLFSAALPNRFVAIVPADRAANIAAEIQQHVRQWIYELGEEALKALLETAGLPESSEHYCWQQLREQLAEFPEVHWASVPWQPLVGKGDVGLNVTGLREAATPFFAGSEKGYVDSPAFKTLNREIELDGTKFYQPNPGVLYPAIYELLERVAAAAKATRTFSQQPQQGYRCSLTGEAEWLTTDRAQLDLSPGQRKNTLWARVADKHPTWARKGEHLCAQAMLKRLWPTRFLRELKDLGLDIDRYVVSTHAVALSSSMAQWLGKSDRLAPESDLAEKVCSSPRTALPRKLVLQLHDEEEQTANFVRRLPGYLEQIKEAGEEDKLERTRNALKRLFGRAPQAYYALVLMDGDRMGAWLSGGDERTRPLSHSQSWHPDIRHKLRNRLGEQAQTFADTRSLSPSRHMAISGALNDFSLHVARHVVEDIYKGKLLYAGGDDLMAMVAVDDLLPMLLSLRLVYSGSFPASDEAAKRARELLRWENSSIQVGGGHVRLRGKLRRMMGELATASAGAVVAHHMMPLGRVLGELRGAEKAAKDAGRNAFSIRVLKRSGGAITLSAPWYAGAESNGTDDSAQVSDPLQGLALDSTPMGVLIRLCAALSRPELARRVAYLVQEWAATLPGEQAFDPDSGHFKSMLEENLVYQFKRQGGTDEDQHLARSLAHLATQLAPRSDRAGQNRAVELIRDFLGVAEFFARSAYTDVKSGAPQLEKAAND